MRVFTSCKANKKSLVPPPGLTASSSPSLSYTQQLEQRIVELEAALEGSNITLSGPPLEHVLNISSSRSDVVSHPGPARAAESMMVEGDGRVSYPESTSLFQLPGSIRTRHIDQDAADEEMAVKKQSLVNSAWRERAFEKLADTPVR